MPSAHDWSRSVDIKPVHRRKSYHRAFYSAHSCLFHHLLSIGSTASITFSFLNDIVLVPKGGFITITIEAFDANGNRNTNDNSGFTLSVNGCKWQVAIVSHRCDQRTENLTLAQLTQLLLVEEAKFLTVVKSMWSLPMQSLSLYL